MKSQVYGFARHVFRAVLVSLSVFALVACSAGGADEHTGMVSSKLGSGYQSRFKLMNSATNTAFDLYYTSDGATNWYKIGAVQSLGIANTQHAVTAPMAASYDQNQTVHIAYVSSSHAVEVVYSANLAASWGHFSLGTPSGYAAYGKPGLISYANLDTSKHLEIYVPFYCSNSSLCTVGGADVLYRRVFNGSGWGSWQFVTSLPDGFGKVYGQWAGVPTILASAQMGSGRTDIAFNNGNGILTQDQVHMFSTNGGSSWSQETWSLPHHPYQSAIGSIYSYAPAFPGSLDFFISDENGFVDAIHYDGSSISSIGLGLPAGSPCNGSLGLGVNALRGSNGGEIWLGCRFPNSSNNSGASMYTTEIETWSGTGPNEPSGYWNQDEGAMINWGVQ